LAGDPSDNIPGVPGIGNKTATALLQKFDSLVKLYETIEKDSSNLDIKPRILNLLIENKAQAFLSQRLATIRRDVLIDFDLEKSRWGDYDRSKLKDFFEEMQFHSLLRRFSHERGEVPKTKESEKKKEQDEQLKLL
jgi:DNA polymerase-1